ncbi:DUF58 domain-containing protein [Xanthomonadaceae bacterium JHOS43]|nr:DUF58 domain-containing protein [Xanthomonadaceae bacterium JHOS43]
MPTRTPPALTADSHEHPRVPAVLRRFVKPRGKEPLPIALHRRRIYVLPTPYGLFFAVLLAAMTVGGLNYNNNPALILCFLMLSLMLSCLLRGYLNLSGVRLESLDAAPVHAGEIQRLRFRFVADSRRLREGLILERNGQRVAFSLSDGNTADVALPQATNRRGMMPAGRFKLHSRQPLGLFEVWSWLHPDTGTLVWPALEKDPPPPPGDGGQNRPRPQRGNSDEPIALRDYRSGDPMRQVAWKHSARLDRLLVREYEQPAGSERLLSWDALAPMPGDSRARRLASWVVDAERQGQSSTLLMPGTRIGPGQGQAHLHACFRALALQP